MRALEVVVLNEQRNPPLAVGEVGEHRLRQELVPHRLPEPFDLSAGLRMMRAALDVPNSVPVEFLLEVRVSAPGRVLPTLVRQDLARRAVVRDSPRQRFHHQRAPLMVRERNTHQIPRVIVEECRDIHPLVSAEQEREQVALPELVRLRALETTGLRPGLVRNRLTIFEQSLLVQNAPDRRLRNSERLKAFQNITDPARPPRGVLSLHGGNRVALRLTFRPWWHLRHSRNRAKAVFPGESVPSGPFRDRGDRNAIRLRDPHVGHALIDDRPRCLDANFDRPGASRRGCFRVAAVAAASASFPSHLSFLSPTRVG